jgi:hypothetical protein
LVVSLSFPALNEFPESANVAMAKSDSGRFGVLQSEVVREIKRFELDAISTRGNSANQGVMNMVCIKHPAVIT